MDAPNRIFTLGEVLNDHGGLRATTPFHSELGQQAGAATGHERLQIKDEHGQIFRSWMETQ